MKLALSLTICFLFSALITNLPLAFSNDGEQVLDNKGNPIFAGRKYYILPAIRGLSGGGLKLGKIGDSKCPVTVLQDYSERPIGIPVKFSTFPMKPTVILTGLQLEIEVTNKPNCAESSKWLVFVDYDIQKDCVGIGGSANYPDTQILDGTFNIQKYKRGYKLVFCDIGSPSCSDIGRFDNNEGGRRLILTEHEAFDIVFVDAASYEERIIKSVA